MQSFCSVLGAALNCCVVIVKDNIYHYNSTLIAIQRHTEIDAPKESGKEEKDSINVPRSMDRMVDINQLLFGQFSIDALICEQIFPRRQQVMFARIRLANPTGGGRFSRALQQVALDHTKIDHLKPTQVVFVAIVDLILWLFGESDVTSLFSCLYLD